MTTKREVRAAAITTRSVGEHPHGGFTARVLRYGKPADDYNTTWARGVANESLSQRMPVLAWGHSWADPIGRAVRWWEEDDGLYMEFAFDDPDDVPRSRQARSQVQSGTLTDVSVGFVREAADPPDKDGTVNITKASIDEVSVVLRGAVAGAQVLAVRSRSGRVDIDAVVEIAKRKAAGELTDTEAQAALELLGSPEPTETPAVEPPTPMEMIEATGPSDEAVAAMTAELDAALESIGRSARR